MLVKPVPNKSHNQILPEPSQVSLLLFLSTNGACDVLKGLCTTLREKAPAASSRLRTALTCRVPRNPKRSIRISGMTAPAAAAKTFAKYRKLNDLHESGFRSFFIAMIQ